MTVVTRFAPSPTGFLHIGGARTALFNWLYARHHGGRFLLRVEDTDRARSTDEAKAAIVDGLQWLGLDWDGNPVFQSERAERHAEVARELLEKGQAYRCYASQAELEEMRETARREGRTVIYDGRWRDRDPSEAPPGVDPVIRIKAPRNEGETAIEDRVQGRVTVPNTQLDDMVLVRADGSPTYMLSVVVDDHDMGITHVIRGDDHLTNAFRQSLIYRAMGWELPIFAHIPLIHGPDGAKLSKRHGALGVETYREMGFLPEALRNYLLRLGWSQGDEEIIPTDKAIEWFDLGGIGRSPARFDMAKLENVNAHYLKAAEPARLAELITPLLEAEIGRSLDAEDRDRLVRAMDGLTPRAKTLVELANAALFYVRHGPQPLDEKARRQIEDGGAEILAELLPVLERQENWSGAALEAAVRQFADDRDLALGKIAQPLRAALTGSTASPGIFEVLTILGRDETLARVGKCVEFDTVARARDG